MSVMQRLSDMTDFQFALLLIAFAGTAFAAICVGVLWFEMSQRFRPWHYCNELPARAGVLSVERAYGATAGVVPHPGLSERRIDRSPCSCRDRGSKQRNVSAVTADR
jgi:hypothetical protein